MTHYCLDACSLINLLCGWAGLRELRALGPEWSTSLSALGEVKHVNEFSEDGSTVRRAVDAEAMCLAASLQVHRASTEHELATLARIAGVLDDGEAECLALSKHRGWVLVSDDALAVRQAHIEGVACVGSIDLVRRWAAQDINRVREAEVVRRIRFLANYVPSPSSPHRPWWDALQN